MFDTFIATLSPMLVMFLCMMIGYILKKKRLLPDNADTVMSKMENFVFVPALILSNFMNYCTIQSLQEQYVLILYSLLALFIALIMALPLSKVFSKKDKYKRNIYKYALTFGNFSFMGNAIVPAILGAVDQQILYKYLLFILPLNLVVYTWGIIILIPEGKSKGNVFKNLLNPIFTAIIIGAILGLTDFKSKMPLFIISTIDYCKSCMAPIAMLLTGFVIGGYSMKGLIVQKKVYIATVLRLFIFPSIILGVLMLAKASDLVLTLAFFAYATPLGLNTVVFPAAYDGDTKTGAAMAMISHTICIISIPLMYALLTYIIKIR